MNAGSSPAGHSASERWSLAALVVLAVAAFLLVGCTAADDQGDGSAASASRSASESTVETTDTTTSTTEPATDVAGDEDLVATDGDDSNAVGDDVGTIVVLGQEALLADVLSLGLTPAAAGANIVDEGFLGMGELDTEGIDSLNLLALSLEEVAGFEADTVVTTAQWADLAGGEELVRALAERVVIVPDGLGPAERLAVLGQELEAGAAAERLVADLEEAEAKARTVIDGLDEPCRISMAAIYPGPSPAAFVEAVWDQPATAVAIGCTLVPGAEQAAADGNGRAFLSIEQLSLLDAPILVLLQSDTVEGEQASLDELTESGIWQQLPAVVSGNVVQFDRLGYAGVAGRIRFVEDLVSALQS